MQRFTDKRVPDITIEFDGALFRSFRNGQQISFWAEKGDPALVAKRMFDQMVRSQNLVKGLFGNAKTDEDDPREISSRIDQLRGEIEAETDPAKKDALKKEALRLMAQESRDLAKAVLEGETPKEWLLRKFKPRRKLRRRG